MALVVKDRVKQTTTTTGTGTLTLNGTLGGFQTFAAALSDGDTTYYALLEPSTNEWEVGLGTWAEGSSLLARTTILESSNSGSAINLTASEAEVFITYPAEKAVYLDASGNISIAGTVDGRDISTDGTKLDGIEAGATADQTASEILTAIKTVDGSGSGLDADLLDGLQASQFLRSDTSDTMSGNISFASGSDLSGGLDSNLTGFFLPQNPEGKHLKSPYFFNDIAYSRLRGATVSVDVDGSPMTSTTNIDAMLNANGDFWNMSTSGVTTATITITDLPKGLTYGSYMGLTFGNPNWRANSITLEHSTDNGSTWTTARSTTSNTEEYFLDSFSSSSTSTNALRWTLEDFNSTQMRVVSLFAYNYNSSGMEGLYVTRDGGDVYGNITITGTVDGRDVAADGTKLDGIEAGATIDQTPSELLTAIKTVDGSGSGLDADTVDGVHADALKQAVNATALTSSDSIDSVTDGWYRWTNSAPTGSYADYMVMVQSFDGAQPTQLTFGTTNHIIAVRRKDSGVWSSWAEMWSNENDGSGSGLDADLLDGQQGSYYARKTYWPDVDTNIGDTNNPLVTFSSVSDYSKPAGYRTMLRGTSTSLPSSHGETFFGYTVTSKRDTGGGYSALLTGFSGDNLWFTYTNASSDTPSWKKVWNDGNDGAGSGLDADLLDGQQGSYYAVSTGSQSNDFNVRSVKLANLEKSNLTVDGQLGFDSSQGLLVFRTQQGVSGTTTVLDGANVDAGTGVTITNLGTGGTGTESFTFSIGQAVGTSDSPTFGNITVTGTVDGRDVAADGTKLDGIEASADVTDTANVTSAGALMTTGGTMTGDVAYGDNVKATFGASNDMVIYHDGTHSNIENGTGALHIRNSTAGHLKLQAVSGEQSLVARPNGSVELYYDNAKKLETSSIGINVTGIITADDLLNIESTTGFGRIEVGGPSGAFIDLKTPFSDDYDGRLFCGGSSLYLTTSSDIPVILKHNDAEKIRTTSTGINVTGNLAVTGTVDGRDIATNIPASLGTAGQVLTVNSGATAAEWADASASADITTVTPSGTTYTLDLSQGTHFDLGTIKEDSTVNVSNIPASGSFNFLFEADYFYNSIITWSSDFDWDGGYAPTLATNRKQLFSVTKDAGSSQLNSVNVGDFTSDTPSGPFFVGSAGNTSNNGGAVSVDLTSITDLAEDDLVIAFTGKGDANTGLPGNVTSSGWTQLGENMIQNDTEDTTARVYYKFMGATPDTAFDIAASGGSDASQGVICYAVRGADLTTPFDGVTPTFNKVANTVLANPPSITPSGVERLIVAAGFGASNGAVGTYASSDLSDFLSVGVSDAANITIGVGSHTQVSSSAFDAAAFTYTAPDSGAFSNVGFTCVIKSSGIT